MPVEFRLLPTLLAETTERIRAELGDEAYAAAFEEGRADPRAVVADAARERSLM